MKQKHCCFCTDINLYKSVARIHVPLAKTCTLGCRYCNYQMDSNITFDEKRPGTAQKVVTDYEEIEQYLGEKMKKLEKCEIIGVSGPGDPLENLTELSRLHDIVKRKYPDSRLCICTNGRYFDEAKEMLLSWEELEYFTVTINTLRADTAMKIYSSIKHYDVANVMINNQINAIKSMHNSGREVKVNTVYIPGINSNEIESMFAQLLECGVDCFNLLPIVDTGKCSKELMKQYLDNAHEGISVLESRLRESGFPLTCLCKQCRADFCGI